MLNYTRITFFSLALFMTACGTSNSGHNNSLAPLTTQGLLSTVNGPVTVATGAGISNTPHCPMTAIEVQVMINTASQNRGTIYTNPCTGLTYGTQANPVSNTIYAAPGLPIYTNAPLTNNGTVNQPNWGTTNQPNLGTTNQPNWGTTNQPNLGTTNQPNWGTTTQPNYGTSNFGHSSGRGY